MCGAETSLASEERLETLERSVNGLVATLEENGFVAQASSVSPEKNAIHAVNSTQRRDLNGRYSDGEEIEQVSFLRHLRVIREGTQWSDGMN